jgi:hypothetical protein
VSERDLSLKLRTARWFWAMGSAVVLRVRLTSYSGGTAQRRKGGSPSLTDLADLDVLGVEVGPDYLARYRAAECKSAKAGAKELFWLRGVLDYFGGGDGFLVVHYDDVRTPALRELAGRMQLGVITVNDFDALDAAYRPDSVADVLFEAETLARADQLLRSPSKGLERLTDYTLRLYWQLPQHRNLQQGVGFLRSASESLRPDQRAHVLLFGEVVFRYLLSLYALCADVLRRGYPHTRDLALAYLHGGALGLHEAQQRVRAVQALQQQLEGGDRVELAGVFNEAPQYFDAMLDVVERLLRHPALATAALRQLTVALHGVIVAERPSWELLEASDPLAGKLVNDVAAFLTRAAGLDRGLRERLSWALETEREAVAPSADATAADATRQVRPHPPGSASGEPTSSPTSDAEDAAKAGAAQPVKGSEEGSEKEPSRPSRPRRAKKEAASADQLRISSETPSGD